MPTFRAYDTPLSATPSARSEFPASFEGRRAGEFGHPGLMLQQPIQGFTGSGRYPETFSAGPTRSENHPPPHSTRDPALAAMMRAVSGPPVSAREHVVLLREDISFYGLLGLAFLEAVIILMLVQQQRRGAN